MNNQALLLSRLKAEYSVDEWSEYIIDDAIGLANRLTESDWMKVCREWLEFELVQQIRIAEIASSIEDVNSYVVNMLIEMLSSANVDVVESSLDSLNAILQSNAAAVPVERLRSALNSVEVNGSIGKAILKRIKTLVQGDI